MRGMDSQTNPTDVKIFTSIVLKEISKERPKPVLRVGRLTTQLLLFKRLLPDKILDFILRKRYGLNKMIK
jgi:hypothetical protein